jgi:hypothetical protein
VALPILDPAGRLSMGPASSPRFRALIAVACLLLGALPLGAQAPPPPRTPARILGVYDALSALPVEGAEVVDLVSGVTAITTITGTVTLAFLPEGFTLLRIRKLGFEPATVPVVISPVDTAPITVVLMRAGQTLPGIVAGAPRPSADTIRQLVASGFYSRRQTSGAPVEAFITAEQLVKAESLRDLRSISGRALCTSNLYVDGTRIDSGSTAPPILPNGGRRGRGADTTSSGARAAAGARQNIDQTVPITMIAGVETYHGSEIPAQYATSQRLGAAQPCLSLIWTR